MNKKFAALVVATVVTSGCASVPQINMPPVSSSQSLKGKPVAYEVLYTQPLLGNPWTTPADKYYPLSSIDESLRLLGKHDADTFAEAVLPTIPGILKSHLGSQATDKFSSGSSLYTLKVEIKTDNKEGPIDTERNRLASMPSGILSLGFANSSYDLVADFQVKYTLSKGSSVIATKRYEVEDRSSSYWTPNERTDADVTYGKKLFKRNLDLTLSDFLGQLPPTL